MPLTHTEILLRAGLILETLQAHPDVDAQLKREGFTQTESGRARFTEAMGLVGHLIEHGDDFTAHNQTGRAIDELNAWRTTTTRLLSQAHEAPLPDDWAAITGEDVSNNTVEFTAMMRIWRLITALRTRPDVWRRIEAKRPRLTDDLQRGYVMLRRSIKTVDKLHNTRHPNDHEEHLLDQFAQCCADLEGWSRGFFEVAESTLSPEVLGLTGSLPEGVGLPFGGAAFDVMRHHKAQQPVPEGMRTAPDCPGWGIGTRRNRENYWDRSTEPQ